MARFSFTGLSAFLRSGVYGLALAIPVFAGSADSKSTNRFFKVQQTSLALNDEVQQQQLPPSAIQPTLEELSRKVFFDKDRSFEVAEGSSAEPRVLIREVIIEGLDGHPEKERLEFAAYDAMSARPGSTMAKDELKLDLDAIYSTGWFSGVRIEPVNGPLGIQIVVEVEPNPIFKRVELLPKNVKLDSETLASMFQLDFGKTLNLNTLQSRIRRIKKWYLDQGYSLTRISGPERITSSGLVQLKVVEGLVKGVEVNFLNKEGEAKDEEGKPIIGKTRRWVIEREISTGKGDIFNRKKLESDIKRLYGTSLFSDVKVTLRPAGGEPGDVIIVLGVIEQSTGSLSGGIGYSQSQGVFGQIGLQDTNLLGRALSSTLNLTYGQYGGLANLTFADPWIKGDRHRTSFRTSVFLSREVPQAFRSEDDGTIRSVSDYAQGDSTYAYNINSNLHNQGKFESVGEAKEAKTGNSWFDYDGNSVALQRTGASFVFGRPLNGGDPYKKAPWSFLFGMNVQNVRPIDYSGSTRPYGVATKNFEDGAVPNEDVVCIAFNCAKENELLGVRVGATYNQLNDSRNPTAGNFLSIGTEQFFSVGENSPTFNRARFSYSHFFPVNWLKISKACRNNSGEKGDCPQAIGLQMKGGTVVGQLPPYEAFCLGGSNSVRGWSSCDLGV